MARNLGRGALGLMLPLALAACGGGGGGTTASTTPPPPPTTTSAAPPNVRVAGADCLVNDTELQDVLPQAAKSATAGGLRYHLRYTIRCRKPPPGGPLKGVSSDIQIGQAGASPTNAAMPTTDGSGVTEKTIDPLPARYAGATVHISVTGTDGNRYEIGSSDVPTP